MLKTLCAYAYGIALTGLVGVKLVQIGVALSGVGVSTQPPPAGLLFLWQVVAAVLTSGFWLLPVALGYRGLAGAGARSICILTHAPLAFLFALVLALEIREPFPAALPLLSTALVGFSGCILSGYVLYRLVEAEVRAPADEDILTWIFGASGHGRPRA